MTNNEMLTRAFAPVVDVELRGKEGRTVYGLLVPYDSTARIRDAGGTYDEQFRMGSFAKTLQENGHRVKAYVNHNHKRGDLPIGVASGDWPLHEETSGLVGGFHISNTREGNEALELVRDGVLDSFSIGFRVVKDLWSKDRTSVIRAEVMLRETSIVDEPAYTGAQIAGIRSLDTDAAEGTSAVETEEPHTVHSGLGISPDERAAYLRALDLQRIRS